MLGILFFLLLYFAPQWTMACENEYYPANIWGDKIEQTKHNQFVFHRGFSEKEILKLLHTIEENLAKKYDFKLHSDYAVNLARIGKAREAQVILSRLLKAYPQEYNLMANLGTVYELNHNLDSAMFWLKKAHNLNPKAHKSSEWIHLKIIEIKIKFGRNLDWLQNNSSLGLNINQLKTAPYSSPDYKKAQAITEQLKYQLQKRIPFTAPPDELTAGLLTDLAELSTLFDVEDSYRIYHYALVYKTGDKTKLQQKIQVLKSRLLKLKLSYPKISLQALVVKPLKIRDYLVKDFFKMTQNKSSNSQQMWLIGGLLLLGGVILWLFLRPKK
jgi:tetratricopeptide (TPR) repeat protein